MLQGIETLKKGLLSLFLKSNCPLCERPATDELCDYCEQQLLRCQLDKNQFLCNQNLPLFVWGNYGGPLKRVLAALKYENQPQLAHPLGHWLGKAWLKSSATPSQKQKLIVVPIPMHPTKQQQRGYNQAELIAQSFCELTGYKQAPLGLERVRATQPQFSLSVQERAQNLADAFIIGKHFLRHHSTSPVLILDDIYTSGATVQSATTTLRKHGITVHGSVAIGVAAPKAIATSIPSVK
ncbi:ComF family protein [Moorena bouillonii]|uniref:Phosphoribosyltransferase n=1 Tax=Moorena bouillonii PNG TaxID=568701 RepID=A0A1U7N3Q3_9CYAN|nr:ComF family protein [Moorena bouillonii]OLT60587.1 phosphoribosyltransferase [Moorena bouillonii PNG]